MSGATSKIALMLGKMRVRAALDAHRLEIIGLLEREPGGIVVIGDDDEIAAQPVRGDVGPDDADAEIAADRHIAQIGIIFGHHIARERALGDVAVGGRAKLIGQTRILGAQIGAEQAVDVEGRPAVDAVALGRRQKACLREGLAGTGC